jgi:hypothetical protein
MRLPPTDCVCVQLDLRGDTAGVHTFIPMRRHIKRIAILVALVSALAGASCAKPDIVFVEPTDARLAQKLRLSEQEWQEIQSELQKHLGDPVAPDLVVKWWGRSARSGLVEAGGADPKDAASGQIFFFRRDAGHWHLLREMTVWSRHSA